jgi:hypothetical protein
MPGDTDVVDIAPGRGISLQCRYDKHRKKGIFMLLLFPAPPDSRDGWLKRYGIVQNVEENFP